MNKCVFLDRDGVLNEDRADYVYRVEDFRILPGVVEGLKKLKEAGYLLIVVTNQAGIAKGLYTPEDVLTCHHYLQEQCGHLIDALYYCPHHPDFSSESLRRKPNSLMLEKAIARYNIDVAQSWMFGDAPRDMQAGRRVGVRTVHITHHVPEMPVGDQQAGDLLEATRYVLQAA